MSETSDRPEGWYPDPAPPNPASPSTMRWWDGRGWTAQVRSAKKHEVAEMRLDLQARQAAYAQQYPAAAATMTAAQVLARGPSTPDGQPLTGYGRRVASYLLDQLACGILLAIFGFRVLRHIGRAAEQWLLQASATQQMSGQPPSPASFFGAVGPPFLAYLAISVLVSAVYYTVFLKGFGATPGKMLLGLEVRPEAAAGSLSWGTVVVRWVAFYLLGFVWLLDLLWPLWDAQRQTLHDKIAGTVVVRARG